MSLPPKEALDTMLGHLGYAFDIQESVAPDGMVTLQVYTGDAERLIGPGGQTLDDLQFLLNRMLQAKDRQAPRVIVDVEHYRTMLQDNFLKEIRVLAEQVRLTGRPVQLEPMNSYDRRIVHTAFKDDPHIMSSSPPDDARLKRITLSRRAPGRKDEG
jgi:spoIIIJ-associated protein